MKTQELSRLIRYVGPGVLSGEGTLSVYDKATNLIIINRELYDRLSESEQRSTLTTERAHISVRPI